MSNWKQKQTYCYGCKKWYDTVHIPIHDPRGIGQCTAGGGQILIDTDTVQEYCMACQQTWPAEEATFYCNICGRVQKTNYSDSAVVVQSGQGVLITDGEEAYAATRTKLDVVGERRYHDIRGI